MAVWQALFWRGRRWRRDKHYFGRGEDGGVASTVLGGTTAGWQALFRRKRRWWYDKHSSGGNNDCDLASTAQGGENDGSAANAVALRVPSPSAAKRRRCGEQHLRGEQTTVLGETTTQMVEGV